MVEELVDAMANLREEETLRIVREMAEGGEDPLKILGLSRDAMAIVGDRFEKGEYFLPELIMAGEILREVSDIVKPNLKGAVEIKRLGKVVIGTVEGDIHDIGKNIVVFMMDVNGFEVYDLGIDVPPQKFVEKIREVKPEIVGLSGFLTLCYDSMKTTVEAIRDAGLRDEVKVMVGGGQINESVAKYAGADAYREDAQRAVLLAREWVGV
jgi:5-methyltetrahydrofolate--homocysteine methyltransferase